MPLLPTRTVNEALQSIFQMYNIKVYKQPNGFTTEFKVRKDLGLMDRGKRVHGLDLDNDKVLNYQVHPIPQIELDPTIDDRKTNLRRRLEPCVQEFILQAGDVSAL